MASSANIVYCDVGLSLSPVTWRGTAFPAPRGKNSSSASLEPLGRRALAEQGRAEPSSSSGGLSPENQMLPVGKPLLSFRRRPGRRGLNLPKLTVKHALFIAALGFLCQIPDLPSRKGWLTFKWDWYERDLTNAPGAWGLEANTFFREKRDSWLSSELIHLLNGNVKAWQALLLMILVLRYSWAANSRPHENGFCHWNQRGLTLSKEKTWSPNLNSAAVSPGPAI